MEYRPELRIAEAGGVYRPAEDTFLLLAALEVGRGEGFLDVGAGTGVIALHAAAAGARVVATDVDAGALDLAARNARANGLELHLVRAHLLRGLRGPFDVVAFNPPYLPRGEEEPDDRWTGGQRGGELLAAFLRDLPRVLAPSGRAYTVASSLTGGPWRRELDPWAVDVVGRRRFPFEELVALRLRPRAAGANL